MRRHIKRIRNSVTSLTRNGEVIFYKLNFIYFTDNRAMQSDGVGRLPSAVSSVQQESDRRSNFGTPVQSQMIYSGDRIRKIPSLMQSTITSLDPTVPSEISSVPTEAISLNATQVVEVTTMGDLPSPPPSVPALSKTASSKVSTPLTPRDPVTASPQHSMSPTEVSPRNTLVSPRKTAGSEHSRRLRDHHHILSPPPFSGGLGLGSDVLLSPDPRAASRTLSPPRETLSPASILVPPPPTTTLRNRFERKLIEPPAPGVAEVFVVEWSPHCDPQILEVQRGGGSVGACAILHLAGVRHTIIPADSLVEVSISGSMWISMRCKDGTSHRLRPRNPQDYGPLTEALGTLQSVGIDDEPQQKAARRGSPIPTRLAVPTNVLKAVRIAILVLLSVGTVFYISRKIHEWGTSPVVRVEQFGIALDIDQISCCRIRDKSDDCSLFLINCGNDYSCKFDQQVIDAHVRNTTTVVGLVGQSASVSLKDPYLSSLGHLIPLKFENDRLDAESERALSSKLEKECPKHFSVA